MSILNSKYREADLRRFLPLILMISLVVGLAGCKTSQRSTSSALLEPHYLSSKAQLTVPHKDGTITVNGTMKLKSGERMQLSFLMPIFRSEIVRLEVTPDEVLLIDRMGKRYVRASREELKDVLPKKVNFARLEKLLLDASKPGGKSTLTGKELGIPSMEKGKIELTDFSDKEFTIAPTEVSAKYVEVEWTELLKMLTKL